MEATPAALPVPDAPQKSEWTHSALLSRGGRVLGLVVMLASLVLPAAGSRFGPDLCVIHNVTSLPCPGCGMTRAIIALTHGDLQAAVGLHPFVLFAWPLFAFLAALALLPASASEKVDRWLARRPWVARFYKVIIFAFAGFGALRFALFAALRQPFP